MSVILSGPSRNLPILLNFLHFKSPKDGWKTCFHIAPALIFGANLCLFQTVWLNKLNTRSRWWQNLMGQTGNGNKVFSHACILEEVTLWKYITCISKGMFLKKILSNMIWVIQCFAGLIKKSVDFSLQFILKANSSVFREGTITMNYTAFGSIVHTSSDC